MFIQFGQAFVRGVLKAIKEGPLEKNFRRKLVFKTIRYFMNTREWFFTVLK